MVSHYQMDNLYFYLITTYNLYFSDTNILKNYSSYIFHSWIAENFDVYSVQRNLKPLVYAKTLMNFWFLFKLLSGVAHFKSKLGSTDGSVKSKSNIDCLFYYFWKAVSSSVVSLLFYWYLVATNSLVFSVSSGDPAHRHAHIYDICMTWL